VQPFSISYAYADLHVIAFLVGHPEYEAIEALIEQRASDHTFVRAILTRQDNSQVDYVNDHEEAMRRSMLTGRPTYEAAIDVTTGQSREGRTEVAVRFALRDGEPVELRIVAAAAPSAAFGGLTDPRGHAGSSSLPVMWRDASALASSVTVHVGSTPVAVATGPLGADAYLTRGFRIGVLRASRRELQVQTRPPRPSVGALWRFRSETGIDTYRISAVRGDMVTIEGDAEVVTGRLQDDRIELQRIRVGGQGSTGLVLDLESDGRFTVGIDGHLDLVTGFYTVEAHDNETTWVLSPQQPAWAVPRRTVVRETVMGNMQRSSVTIG
jgi:hypothetical protein